VRCSSCNALLVGYIEETLTAHETARVRAHLEACPICRHILEELRVVDAFLLTVHPPEPAENLTFRVMAEVRSLPAHRARHASFLSVGATYLVFAWCLLFAWFRFGGVVAHASLALLQTVALQYLSAAKPLMNATAHLFGHQTIGVTAAMLCVLALDIVAAAALVASYVFVLPRLAAHVARSEVPS